MKITAPDEAVKHIMEYDLYRKRGFPIGSGMAVLTGPCQGSGQEISIRPTAIVEYH